MNCNGCLSNTRFVFVLVALGIPNFGYWLSFGEEMDLWRNGTGL